MIFALFLSTFASLASANPSAGAARLGDSLVLELKDQHDQNVAINDQTNLILFAAGKSTSALMSKTLEDLPPTTLKDKKNSLRCRYQWHAKFYHQNRGDS
jgi:hypothetical protein